jgi:hypothetical protein
MDATRTGPVRMEARPDEAVSRWLPLVKWLLLVPHYVVLVALWLAFVVTTVAAFFAVLFTGRYPRGIFHFNVGVLRWSWRVGYYGYGALGTDRYPPFTLGAAPDYPATLDVAYPERLSRGLALVKTWLLAIPHYLIVAVLAGGIAITGDQTRDVVFQLPQGLLGLIVLFMAVALLFTGGYPRGLHDLAVGINRWAFRVVAYAALMTDEYPPFRLDQGGSEPAPGPAPPAGPAPTGRARDPGAPARGSGAGAVAALVVGLLALLPALGTAAAGGALLWLDTRRDAGGYVSTDTAAIASATAAVTVEDVDLTLDQDAVRWLAENDLGEIRVRVTGDDGTPVFVGIAAAADVDRWLAGTAHDEIVGTYGDGDVTYRRSGRRPADLPAPGDESFWVASAAGPGPRELTWAPADGTWSMVIARADGGTGVAAAASAAARIPDTTGWGAGLLAGGLALLVVSVVLIAVGANGLGHRAAGPGGGVPAGGPPPVPSGAPPREPAGTGAGH